MANKVTHSELVEMWKRPVERQHNIAISKIMEAINDTEGNITVAFSGGKDSSLLLDMFAEVWKMTPYSTQPIKVAFANTTVETGTMISFVRFFIGYIEKKYDVKIDLTETRPKNGQVWANVIKQEGLPLISKDAAKLIRVIRRDMDRNNVSYQQVVDHSSKTEHDVKWLRDAGFANTAICGITGYVTSKDFFGNIKLAKRWYPMLACPVPISEKCCEIVKEYPMKAIDGKQFMTGEQAAESKRRLNKYLITGCNARLYDGSYKSKPFGSMTNNGILWSIKHRNVPICPDYGDIVKDGDNYKCTKCQRTGCAFMRIWRTKRCE